MDIFTLMAPRRTTVEWLFNGKQGHCVRPAKGSPRETANLKPREKHAESRRGAQLTAKIKSQNIK